MLSAAYLFKHAHATAPLLLLALCAGILGCKPVRDDGDFQETIPLPPAATVASTSAMVTMPPPVQPPEGEPFKAADPAHVDAQEIAPQARALAVRVEPHAVLMRFAIYPAVNGATMDLRPRSTNPSGEPAPSLLFTFEYLYFDKTRPPGQDKVQGEILIRAQGMVFKIQRSDRALSLSRPKPPPPGPDPRCSARDAWRAAVKSGMPADAVASVSYEQEWPPGLDLPYVWSFRVDGHPELRREIDGMTCAGPAPPSASTRAVVPPVGDGDRGAAPPPCGCAAGDLLCVMRCQNKAKANRSGARAPGSLTDVQ
jgi:hypothetical protein